MDGDIKSEEQGTKYGLNIPEKFIDENLTHLAPLISDIKKGNQTRPVTVFDFGGGNGLMALSLVSALKEHDIHVTIVDEDKSKFVQRKNVDNVHSNILTFDRDQAMDYSIMRNIFHYNLVDHNKDILQKVLSLTKRNLLFVNMFIDESEEGLYKRHEKLIKKWFGSYRNFPTLAMLEKTIKTSGWNILSKDLIIKNNFDFIDFSKRRYNLSDEQVLELIDEGLDKINVDRTAIFWCGK